ncbi:putative nuclear condensing complex subunits, C-term domain [Lyophyllum shimeji]|uniref:Nuclear condensing complex subunits, C-term domain n=1 Tax=Lyophyllum shimeji TaxID=47721 RepID=A0A9P3PVB6_LYOSH|nr:putative nuclear condensing complex subunits, C-term domain [Lyophyllum shimeji]
MVSTLPDILEKIPESLAIIFDQVQLTLANHRKNCVALYKLHHQAAAVSQPSKKGDMMKLVGERKFGDAFIDMVNRVLVVKKGPATADRVVRFIGSYVRFMNERASAEMEKVRADPLSSISAQLNEDTDDTIVSRFVTRLLKWLLQGFLAKNKTIRYRAVCMVSEMISHLGEIDEETYNILRDCLMERICDKESLIRTHAVTALSKLIGSEDPNEVDSGEKTILEVLLDVISYDPAPEVRRAALVHVPLIPTTIETILSRTRDTDALTRKLVYSNALNTKLGHPRQLTIAQRELVMKDGLGDREPSVRVAAGKLAASWFDIVLAEPDEADKATWDGDDGGIMKGFLKFLALFDVVGPGEAVAVDAMLSIFVTRPNISDVFIFPDAYWKELTPESALLARVFIEHCLSTQNETRLEAASLPVVTAFAFHLQESYNALLDVLQEAENVAFLNAGEPEDEEEADRREEELAKKEVVLGEMLRMALKLDYMDEIGRRKVFSVVRDMAAHPELPPGLINPCLDVLKEIMPTERELIRVVVEIIIELREDEDQDNNEGKSILNDESHADITQTTIAKDRSIHRTKPREEMTAEERMEADIRDMRCLTLCIGMLERVDGSFEDNSTLEGILSDLIIPSVKRKELAMREKGLVSLGLCCLIAKNMALSSFQLFLGQVQSAPEELKLRVLQVIFDLLIMYDQEFFARSEDIAQKIINFVLQTLEAEESASVQALLCVGLSKLLLSGMITDPKVLTCLVLTYVSPNTATNQELRQCLSYFFPVYCYSSPDNQRRMQSIFIIAFDLFMRARESLDEDQEMITPQQFGLLLVDWTNPQKSAEVLKTEVPSQDTHVELAVDILGALYDSERSDEELKVLCQVLSHLHIMPGLDTRSIHKLNILLSHHKDQAPFNDDHVQKVFDKFNSRFRKIFVKEIQRIDPGKYLDEEFLEIYKFIGVDPPEESLGREESVATSGSQNLVQNGGEESEQLSCVDEDGASSPTPSPSRHKKEGRAKKAPPRKRPAPVSPPASEEDEEEDAEEEMATPVPVVATPTKKGVKRVHIPGSGAARSSPLTRKKSRVKSPRKSRSQTASTKTGIPNTDTDSDDDVTPVKGRRGLRRGPVSKDASDSEGEGAIEGPESSNESSDDSEGD